MPDPLAVDIVVTSFNYARFLPAAIDSALAQDHPRVRVIVVDDGSRDGSPQIIEGYGDRVQPILKANGGQASAFNAALAAAQGDVVLFLDADDELEPHAAARVAAVLAAEPRLAKVQWRMTAIDGEGRPTGATLPPPGLPLPQGDQCAAELAYSFALTWLATSGNAFPRPVLERILPMPEAPYRVNADWYLQHLTPLLGPVRSLDEPLSRRRFHGDNAYGSDAAELDLGQLRTTIVTAAATRAEIERLAAELGLQRPPGPLLAVSDQANRLISLRLDPARHPVAGDTRRGLVRGGLRAAGRRSDAAPALRAAFRAWFLAMAVAPRAAAVHLGTWFAFPERRPALRREGTA
jgi:hypothetical protein